MKKSMRAFGIGIFLTGAAIAGYDYFFPDQKTADTRALEKQVKQYEKQLKEYEQQFAELNQPAKDQKTSKETPADKAATSEEATETSNATENTYSEEDKDSNPSTKSTEDVIQGTIYIYENLSLYTIGQQAEDLGVVENGRELELYLAKPEYSRSIQKGAFDLRSDMTIEEIAKTLTGKKLE